MKKNFWSSSGKICHAQNFFYFSIRNGQKAEMIGEGRGKLIRSYGGKLPSCGSIFSVKQLASLSDKKGGQEVGESRSLFKS